MTTTYDAPTSASPTDQTNDPRDLDVLPPLGEGTLVENWGKCNSYWDALAQKYVNFYNAPCDQAEKNLTVFETGKSTAVADRDVISNKISKDIRSLMSDLLREPLTRTIEPEENGEPPQMIPVADPTTGQMVPFQITDKVEADCETFITDFFWEKSDLDSDIASMTFNASIAGWYIALFEEERKDGREPLPRLRTNISVRQIMLDPSVGPFNAVEIANGGMLRWRPNWWQARAMLPELAKHLDLKATNSAPADGSIVPLGMIEQHETTGEKKVDLEFLWLRNYPVQKMTPEEAVEYGEVEQRQVQNEGTAQAGNVPTDATPEAGEGTAQAAPDLAQVSPQADGGGGGLASSRPVDAGSLHDAGGTAGLATGVSAGSQLQPIAQYFLPNSNTPITPADPSWPWWLGTRMLARVEKCIALDTISECWDGIPFVHMPANPIPMTACGQGYPETMQRLQEGRNRALTNAVEHSDILAHPVKVYCQSAYDALEPEYQEKGASISGLSVVVPDSIYEKLGGKISVYDDAPPISAALGEILTILGAEGEDQSPAPSVTQGKQTGDITGWQTTQMLQQQAASRLDLPAKFLEKAVRRLMNLVRWWWLWRVPISRLQQICSHLPPEVVEYVVMTGRQTDRNVKVRANISSGGVMARKIADAQGDFQAGLISKQTLCEIKNIDFNKEQQRIAQENQGKQGQPPSESLSFKDLPASGKIQLAAQAGIQLSPQDVMEQQAMEQQAQQQKAEHAAAGGNGRM